MLAVTGRTVSNNLNNKDYCSYSGLSFVDEEAGGQGQEGAWPRLPNDLENIHLQCSLPLSGRIITISVDEVSQVYAGCLCGI